MKLRGKWAIVTGGSRGIGRGICLEMAKEGCNIIINHLSNSNEVKKLVAKIRGLGVEVFEIIADVSKRKQVNDMIAEITEKNKLDILVNNAGVIKFQPILEVRKEDWDFQMNTNLVGAFNVSQEVAKYFVKRGKGGKIIFITSFNQEVPAIEQGVYSITKSGIKMLAKSLALELAKYKINVNTIAAGPVKTDMNIGQEKKFPGLIDRLRKIIPLNRWGTVEDIGKAVVYLASSDSDYVTGSTLYVEGGIMINNGIMINVNVD